MSEKIELTFMVVPEFLESHCYVKDPVKVKITDPEAVFLMGILGESGKKMVKAGIPFYFTKEIAEDLISKGFAEVVK